MDDSGAEDWSPRGETGGGRDARSERAVLRRKLRAGLARCVRAARAVPVGVVITGLVTLAGMTLVLQLAGAWPFARQDAAGQHSVPRARLPLPPSAVGAGGAPSARESGDGSGEESGEDGRKGRGRDDEDRQAMSSPPSGQGLKGRDGGTGSRGCRAAWRVDGQWEDFNATVRVTGTTGERVRGWEISWVWPGGQRLVHGWNGEFRESGATVRVRNSSSNAEIPAGGETTFGFQATGSGSPAPRLTCRAL